MVARHTDGYRGDDRAGCRAGAGHGLAGDDGAETGGGDHGRGALLQLPERFEQAIDRCAMKIGARDSDSYLAEWRKVPSGTVEGEQDEIARATATRLEMEFDQGRIKALIDNDGWAKA